MVRIFMLHTYPVISLVH